MGSRNLPWKGQGKSWLSGQLRPGIQMCSELSTPDSGLWVSLHNGFTLSHGLFLRAALDQYEQQHNRENSFSPKSDRKHPGEL